MKDKNFRWYMGECIQPAYGRARLNGWRWQAGINMYATTLDGIKRLIRSQNDGDEK